MKLHATSKDLLIMESERLISGSVKIYTCEFTFDSSWDGYLVTAVFSTGNRLINMAVADGKCEIPHEVLRPGVRIRIGIFGVDGERTRPTTYSEWIPVEQGADGRGAAGKPPTPSVYEQWVNAIAEDADRAETARGEAVAAQKAAEAAEHNATLAMNTAMGYASNAEAAKRGAIAAREAAEAAKAGALKARDDAFDFRNEAVTAKIDALAAQSNAEAAANRAKDSESYVETMHRDVVAEVGGLTDRMIQMVSATDRRVSGVEERVFALENGGGNTAELEAEIEALRQQVADYHYVKLALTSSIFTATTDDGQKITSAAENGQKIVTATMNWVFNKNPVSVTLNGEDMPVGTSGAHRDTEDMPCTTNREWKLVAKGDKGETVSNTFTLTFLNRVYWGAAAMPAEVNRAFVLGLEKNALTPYRNRSISVDAGAGEYIWYAVPVDLGECTFTVGVLEGGFELVDTIQFTNQHEYTAPNGYRIYKSVQAGLGDTTVEVT